jgi:hypothetical protein
MLALGMIAVAGTARAAFDPLTPNQPKADKVVTEVPGAPSDRNDCTAPFGPIGVASGGLPALLFAGDNTGAGDNFDASENPALCFGSGYGTGNGGSDDVWSFTVDTCGTYEFNTGCAGNAGFMAGDTSMQVRHGAMCATSAIIGCNGDACGSFNSIVTLQLVPGQQYWLVVDSYNPAYEGAYGVEVQFTPSGPCCTMDSDCDDGLFCTGVETCDIGTGTCIPGAGNPCVAPTGVCDEGTDSCIGCTTDADCTNPALPYCVGGACVACTMDAHCDDGLFCNGTQTCNLVNNTCSANSGNPCNILQTCDETNDVCVDPDPCVSWRAGSFVLAGSFGPFGWVTCPTGHLADEVQLSSHAGRELISYQIYTQARDLVGNPNCTPNSGAACPSEPVGSPYTITTELWTAASGGACVPDAPIPGTSCSFSPGVVLPGGSGADVFSCEPNGGLPTGVILPDGDDDALLGQCGVDVWVVIHSSNYGAGWSLDPSVGASPPNVGAGFGQVIGGPAMDDEFGQSAMAIEDCDPGTFLPLGTWSFIAYTGGIGDIRGMEFCTVPEGPCCDGLGGCSIQSEDACTTGGGTYLGDNTIPAPNTCDSPDGDGDGVRDECDLCPMDGGKTEPGQCGCGVPDTDSDGDGTADCNDGCPQDPGKTAPGQCGCGVADDDADMDGVADCNDGCPNDPNKVAPGICGCGVADVGDADGDGYLDCVDQCPGVDDDVFFPGCQGAIPTVSEWGMIVLALLLLVAGKVYFGRRPATV